MPSELERAREIFLHAVGRLPADQWDAYVHEACGADAGLSGRVWHLLQAHAEAGSFLESPAGGLAVTATYPLGEQAAGAMVGPYKLLQKLGEGGMGDVWMAEQTEPVQRKVALKLIRPGMDSKQVVARFEAERQALALMDHPNIARVFDGGATPDGRPFFVMELVKGIPITKYCDEYRLTPRERLELFAQTCLAVQHAHQKGLTHRDLKPSNVLVAPYDGRPVVKVIDFGVAKAAGHRLTKKTLFTEFGAVVGTLEYMSPEQAELNNQDIDTRSDIYSLGVLLYELLTGSTPLTHDRLKEAAFAEVLRVIREEEPPKPSTRLSDSKDALPSISAQRQMEPGKLTKLVRGELDWIVMKALEKDRSRRYETANGFAMDVQRYLADEPVQACPPSAGYRLQKFVRRNKAILAVAALVLFFFVVLGSGVGWAVRDRSARAAEAAQQLAARQGKVAGQVESIFAEVDRLEGEQNWPEALEAAWRARAAVAGGEADAETTEQVQRRLKDLEFIDQLERIRVLSATSVEGRYNNAGADREYATAFRDYGADVDAWAVESSIKRLLSRPALAIPIAAALDDWVSVRRRLSKKESVGWERLVATARGIDPDPLRDWLRTTWMQPASPQVQDELRRRIGSIDVRGQRPATVVSVARTLQQSKQSDDAIRILRDARAIHPEDFWLNFELGLALFWEKDYEGAIRFCTAAVSIRPSSAPAHNNLGLALRDQKKLDEALACSRRANELDDKNATYRINMGYALGLLGRMGEAVAAYEEAIRLHPDKAYAHYAFGWFLHDVKHDKEGAVACFKKSIELDPRAFMTHIALGQVQRERGKLDEAVAAYHKAIELDPKNYLPHYSLGEVLALQRKLDEAVAAYRKAIELSPKKAYLYQRLGHAFDGQGKLDEAVAAFRKANELAPMDSPPYLSLGHVLMQQKKFDDAAAAYRKSIELGPKTATMEHFYLGDALRLQRKLGDAVASYRKAIERNPKYLPGYLNLSGALQQQGKWDDAIAALKELLAIGPQDAVCHNELAWLLATCPDAKFRDPAQAVALAKKAIELVPKNSSHSYSNTLGVAQYRAGDWKAATAALERSIELRNGGDGYDWFFLAMARWRLGDKDKARDWYDRAVQWMEKNRPKNEELLRFRAEAAELLDLKEKK